MSKKILIANRGEIAVRAIRACREAGYGVGVIHSPLEAESLPVRLADSAHRIECEMEIEAYLDGEAIVEVAATHGYDAIYPGYGFLSENPEFSRLCAERGVIFVGPRSDVLADLGDKARAKQLAQQAGLPLLPSIALVELEADPGVLDRLGFPLLVKAAFGGGGRGMRRVNDRGELSAALEEARREAERSFKNDAVYLEKFLPQARHVEFQVAADGHGQVVHLGERDCSLQRRYQKVIEEAPAPGFSEALRDRYGQLSCQLIGSVGLVGLATVEYLFDEATQQLFFIEVNPRIQVEHGVTEAITGVDLVRLQLQLAFGEPLGFTQTEVGVRGHAVECRITHETARGEQWLPSTGHIRHYHQPGGSGIRVCSAIYAGQEITAHFDPLITKLIAHGRDRAEALARSKRALAECVIDGVDTNLPVLRRVLDAAPVQAGQLHTGLLAELLQSETTEELSPVLTPPASGPTALTPAAVARLVADVLVKAQTEATPVQAAHRAWRQTARQEQAQAGTRQDDEPYPA